MSVTLRGGVETGDVLTFRDLPAPPQLLHGDVLVFPVQVAVFVGLLLLHVFYYKLGEERETELSVIKKHLVWLVYNITNVVFFHFRSRWETQSFLCVCVCVHVWFRQRAGFA